MTWKIKEKHELNKMPAFDLYISLGSLKKTPSESQQDVCMHNKQTIRKFIILLF